MPIPKEDLRRCLIRKFGFEETEGSKHEAVALYIDGYKVATTRFSRSHGQISDPILTQIAQQIWVQLGYLKKMVECTKSKDDYLAHLRNTDHLK